MDTVLLRHFVAVAEQLHFARAAKSLGISRAALSSSIKQIELEQGIELFDRSADSTVLTADGRAFLGEALPRLAAETADSARLEAEAAARPALRIAFVPGVSMGKWTDAWEQRRPGTGLGFVPGPEDDAVSVLRDGRADLSFVRLPVESHGLSVIRLYNETTVVVAAKDHPVAAFDAVTLADLSGETVAERPANVADAVELVAAGVGLLLLPQSLARLHQRKDVVVRPITDAPTSDIAIAWLADSLTPDMDEFIGIVRGRTAASSRAGSPRSDKVESPASGDRSAGGGGSASGKPKPARRAGAREPGTKSTPKSTSKSTPKQRNRRRGSR